MARRVEDRLLTPRQVAEILGTSRRTVYRLVDHNSIRWVYLGSSIRVSWIDLQDFIEDLKVNRRIISFTDNDD